jgi:hypothetical protein
MNTARPRDHLFAALLIGTAALAFGGCQRQAQPPAPAAGTAAAKTPSADAWAIFRDQFIEDYFKAQPPFAVNAGRHDFDGQLPDWSTAGVAREVARLHAARDKTAAFDARALSDAQRFEREYLLSQIDRDLFWLETAAFPLRNPQFYLDTGLDPSPYLTRRYAPLEQRMRAYIAYAKAIPRAAEQIEANLRPPLARTLVERGASGFKGLADFYRDDVPKVFATVADATLQADFKQANTAAEAAMRGLSGRFKVGRRQDEQSFALGAGKFVQMLVKTERVTTPLAELEAVGRQDLERNLAALREACARFLPNRPIRACVQKMNQNKPAGGAVEGAGAQLAGLRKFLEERGIVSIPGTEQALVKEAPPFARANFAYIDIPGPYDKGLASVYYIAPPDPSWPPQEQHDYLPGRADLLFTSAHEVWPGHFLQYLHANRNPSIVGRLYVGYGFSEGWAHYTEEMMWEVGLRLKAIDSADNNANNTTNSNAGNSPANSDDDPETHIGQLVNALLRNVRLLSAIGLHTRGMTVAQSEKLFREQAYADPGTAKQQAARGTYDPAYLNYTMGKLMIRKLRDDWCAPRGGRAAWRDFHDTFLSYGGPPIPLVRKAMMGDDQGSLF